LVFGCGGFRSAMGSAKHFLSAIHVARYGFRPLNAAQFWGASDGPQRFGAVPAPRRRQRSLLDWPLKRGRYLLPRISSVSSRWKTHSALRQSADTASQACLRLASRPPALRTFKDRRRSHAKRRIYSLRRRMRDGSAACSEGGYAVIDTVRGLRVRYITASARTYRRL
jgi:hypothetical protein